MNRPSFIQIRLAKPDDHEAIWKIIHPIILIGDTYAYHPDTTREEMISSWCASENHTYVATLDSQVVGTFMMRDNQPGLGSHVANAGFMVGSGYSGLGVGRRMGEYSIREAKRLGYRAMQFNMVISTNLGAIRLWERLGFDIIGEIPEAFYHRNKGYVSVYIMHQLF